LQEPPLRTRSWIDLSGAGTANVVVIEFLASGRAAKPEEWLRLNTLETQAAAAWKLAQRSIEIAGAEASVRAIYARADAAYFTGQLAEMRQAALDALMKGRPIPTSAAEWDAKALIGLNAISEAAIAAIDSAVGKAGASAAAARRELAIAVAAMMFATSFAAAAIIIVQARVVRGILDLVDAMRRLAEGQRQAAMNQIADAFERTAGGIVGRVASSADALQATAKTMATTAAGTAERSFTVAAAADEAAANAGTVAATSEELGTLVREIGRQVTGSADLARAAVDEADRAAELVEALTASVARIDEVVGLISGIAAQTNLLALNATIEAGPRRRGRQGFRGGGRRSEGAGRPDRQGDRRDRPADPAGARGDGSGGIGDRTHRRPHPRDRRCCGLDRGRGRGAGGGDAGDRAERRPGGRRHW